MISPDLLAHCASNGLLIEARAKNFCSNRAALAGIEPAIRSPAQTVHNGMRVFQAKAGEQDFRRTVGDVIVVAVRIKEEIGRIKNIDATAPFHSGSGDV